MTKLGKLWTGAVAYVSLLVGAGLSVAGNLADTYRIRADAVDAVDIALAIGPPLASLLVAELFVSAWPRRLSVQAVRWSATLLVGTLAMVVSWLHIHELLLARGQLLLVAILWPLAIDGLAIMAMAKILVTRAVSNDVQPSVQLDTPLSNDVQPSVQLDTPLSNDVQPSVQLDTPLSNDVQPSVQLDTRRLEGWTEPAADPVQWDRELDGWDKQVFNAIAQAGQELADEAEAVANGVQRPAPSVPVIEGVPAEAQKLIQECLDAGDALGAVDALVASTFNVSQRQARRWRTGR